MVGVQDRKEFGGSCEEQVDGVLDKSGSGDVREKLLDSGYTLKVETVVFGDGLDMV